jgi:hypothetical protein
MYYGYNVVDSASTNSVVCTTLYNAVTLNAVLSPQIASIPGLPSTQAVGNTIVFTANTNAATPPKGGTPSFTYNYIISNYITPSRILANMLFTSCTLTTNYFSWTIPVIAISSTQWVANVIITDTSCSPVTLSSGYSGILTVPPPPCTIFLSNTLSYFIGSGAGGAVQPGSFAPVTNTITDTNDGSETANILLYGSNWVIPATQTSNFLYTNTVWDFTLHSSSIAGNQLAGAIQDTYTQIPTLSSKNIYFGMNVPLKATGGAATPTGTYAQTIIIENSCP